MRDGSARWCKVRAHRFADTASIRGSRCMILEADVSWGSSGSFKETSIMAHPPHRTSDLTFADFCRRICKHNHDVEPYRRVGVKFDFKDARCVVPCLELLRELAGSDETVGWPVFLNADVWMGPGGNPPKIQPSDFFAACFDIYPAGTLSPGWTCWLKFDGKGCGRLRGMSSAAHMRAPGKQRRGKRRAEWRPGGGTLPGLRARPGPGKAATRVLSRARVAR